MPETLIINSNFVTLFMPRNILDYVDACMGYDTKKYMEKLIDQLEDKDYEIEKRMDSDLDTYEGELESNRTAFSEIRACVQTIETEIEKSRCNKNKIRHELREIEKMISNQII